MINKPKLNHIPEISVKVLASTMDALPYIEGEAKYVRLAEAFRQCVREKLFLPGDHIPSEVALSETLPVGLGTIQKALVQMAAEGVVIRQRKKGSYIADRSLQVPEVHVYRYRDPETGALLLPFTRVMDITLVSTGDTPSLLEAFGEDEIVRIDRLVWVEADPPAFSSLYLRLEHGEQLLHARKETLHGTSLHQFLADRFKLPTLSVRHSVSAQPLSEAACRYLNLSNPHIGLVWNATDFSFDKQTTLMQRFELPQGHKPMELRE